MIAFWEFFTDPVLRAPTIGSILMCVASSLVGAVVVLRKRSLLGEALSHAAYPGVVLAVAVFACFFSSFEESFSYIVLGGAFLFALLGARVLDFLQSRFSMKDDSLLCLVLSSFFGVGVLVASRIQFSHPLLYKQVQVFLYGQAATMTDIHVVLYGVLCVIVVVSFLLFFRVFEVVTFDRNFAKSLNISVSLVDTWMIWLLVLAVVVGIRSVGVVLMSGMLVAPVLCARQLTCSMKKVLIFSAIIGGVSGFLGNYLSLTLSQYLSERASMRVSLPTGPMILLASSFFCMAAIILSPKRGLIFRFIRRHRFKNQSQRENMVKSLWKHRQKTGFTLSQICTMQNLSKLEGLFQLRVLIYQGWIEKKKGLYLLNEDGRQKAAHIVRLHRLWEAYLVQMGHSKEKVHASAEEMEHVLTPEIERQLMEFLGDPKEDPHQQPIPGSKL